MEVENKTLHEVEDCKMLTNEREAVGWKCNSRVTPSRSGNRWQEKEKQRWKERTGTNIRRRNRGVYMELKCRKTKEGGLLLKLEGKKELWM
jgi:hypothetical protein